LHVQRSADAELEHYAFLGDGVNDPREDLIKQMIKQLGIKGSIICWNVSFEKSRITELADNFPKYEKQLNTLTERMIDLIVPFRSRWYYHPDFAGSASLKDVLPVMVPDLSYEDLDIQEGGSASLVYSELKNHDELTQAIQRNQLLEYCKLDTLAMVKIFEKLKNL